MEVGITVKMDSSHAQKLEDQRRINIKKNNYAIVIDKMGYVVQQELKINFWGNYFRLYNLICNVHFRNEYDTVKR